MADPAKKEKQIYLEGKNLSPNELYAEYGIPTQEIASFRNFICIYPKNATIIQEGDQEKALYLLRIGSVEAFKDSGPNRKSLGSIEAVNFFGEMSMINDEPRTATIITSSINVVVYRIPNPNIASILTNPKWAELLISRLSKNLSRSLKHDMLATQQIASLETELEQTRKELETLRAETSQNLRNTRMAFNVVLTLQEIIQKMAVVAGSKGWAHLEALTIVTRTMVTRYIPSSNKPAAKLELDIIRYCISNLPADEQNLIIQELSKLA
jgi:CRP-like cAMP-binding protein